MADFTFSRIELGTVWIVVSSHTSRPASAEDWRGYIELCADTIKQIGGDMTRGAAFYVSDGGSPDVKQRKDLYGMLGGKSVRTAVITGSLTARTIVTGISWFNSEIRAFTPSHAPGALGYLRVPPEHKDAMRAHLQTLREKTPTVAALDGAIAALADRKPPAQ